MIKAEEHMLRNVKALISCIFTSAKEYYQFSDVR